MIISWASATGVKVWDIATKACFEPKEQNNHKDRISSVAFSADGKQIVSASFDNTVKPWNVVTGSCLRTFYGHYYAVTSAVFSEDGQWVISASISNIVKIWETATGDCRDTYEVEDASEGLYHPSIMASPLLAPWNIYTTRPARQQTYRLSDNHDWVLKRNKPVLYLPWEYRPTCFAVAAVEGGASIVLGLLSKRILIFYFPIS